MPPALPLNLANNQTKGTHPAFDLSADIVGALVRTECERLHDGMCQTLDGSRGQ